jgi:hypothetical protein
VYRGDFLKNLTVDENRVTLIFDDKIGPDGGKVILVGTYNEKTMGISWQRLSPNIAEISCRAWKFSVQRVRPSYAAN